MANKTLPEYVVAPVGGGADDLANWNAAQTAISAAGGGTLRLTAQPYYLSASFVPADNITLLGVGFSLKRSTGVLSGTVIKALTSGAYPAIAWNDSPLASQPPATGAGNISSLALNGFRCKDIAFSGFSRAVHIGDTYNTGLYSGLLENLYSTGHTDWGFWLENCAINTTLRTLRCQNPNSSANGGIMLATSQINYNNGNLFLENTFAETLLTGVYQRGVVIRAYAGARFNDINWDGLQSNMPTQAVVTQTATVSSGTANITVTDGTKFPVDMPVAFLTTFNLFTAYLTYHVVSQIGNTIQLSATQGGTAIVPTAAGTPSINQWGFSPLEVVARDSGSLIQPCKITGIDAEGSGANSAFVQNASVTMAFNTIGDSQGTSQATSFAARGAQGVVTFSSPVTLDLDDSSTKFMSFPGLDLDTAQANALPNFSPIGVYYDRLLAAGVLRLNRSGINPSFSQINYGTFSGTPALRDGSVLTVASWTPSTNNAGLISVQYTGSQAIIGLPTLSTTLAPGFLTMEGLEFIVVNDMPTAGATTVINAGGTATFGKTAGRTQVTLAQKGYLFVKGATDGTNTWWDIVALDTNARGVTGAMASGTTTVSTPMITANSIVMLTAQSISGTAGALGVSARTPGTSFTITSTSTLDTSTVGWEINEP